jgi:hypothetical protein
MDVRSSQNQPTTLDAASVPIANEPVHEAPVAQETTELPADWDLRALDVMAGEAD